MTVVATRHISQPDRHSFYNAYALPDQAETAVHILEGVTLVIDAVTIAAPNAARIYELFRGGNRAGALTRYVSVMGGPAVPTAEDLADFIYLLDDTIGGTGVPGMAPGQEWTISYQTPAGAPRTSLLTRLRDRQASYGNMHHYRAIAGEGAIQVVYDLAEGVSVAARQGQLARLLRAFFESAAPAARGAAQTSAQFQQVVSNGYVSFTNVRFREGELFFALITGLEYAQWFTPASTAVNSVRPSIPADRRANARTGAMEFMSNQLTLVTLFDNIRTPGLAAASALTADSLSGFQEADTAAKNRARDAARQWRTRALGVVSGASGLHAPVPGHLNNNIRACYNIYVTALYNPAQLPANMSRAYYGHLHTNPADIWGAYTGILAPTGRQMAYRISHIILASWDPSSGTRPPGLAQSLAGTLRTLAGLE